MRRMFLNGTAMAGQKDHGAIAGARFVGPARTAPRYRFLAVRDEFPGLVPVEDRGRFHRRRALRAERGPAVRGPAAPGTDRARARHRELEDGQVVHAMLLQPERLHADDRVVDIAELGGWRAYQEHLAEQPGGLGPGPRLGTAPTCTVLGDPAGTDDVLTPEALDLVAVMSRVHDHARRGLLERRAERAARFVAGERPGLLARHRVRSATATGRCARPRPTSPTGAARSPARRSAR